MSLEGKQIGRYRLIRILGSGGMGDVYLAEDARIEQHIAIKVIRAEIGPYSTEKAREDGVRLFLREAKAIAKLDHPNILPMYDVGEELIGDTTIMFMVMPYRAEGSLAQWLRQHINGTLLTPQVVKQIVQQAAAALQHAHNRQVIHQDVKPSNFLLRTREDVNGFPDLLLSDFGIARFITATSSASQSIRGTPSYMAPEQWEGTPTPSADQYALAVMAYELLTGSLPFQGGPANMMYQHLHVQPKSPGSLNPQLSSEIDAVLLHALAKDPKERFTSISAFANAFNQAVDGMTGAQRAFSGVDLDRSDRTTPLVFAPGFDISAPVKPSSNTPAPESYAVAYVRPPDTPPAATVTATPIQDPVLAEPDKLKLPASGTMEQASRSGTIFPPLRELDATAAVEPPVQAARKKKRQPFLIAALIVLIVALVGGGIVYAGPALFNKGTGSVTSRSNPPAHSQGPAIASSATVTIIPTTDDLKNAFTISAVTGTPSHSQHQVGAQVISASTPSNSLTVNATGTGTIPGTHASGTVCIDNFDTSSSLTLLVGSVYSNTYPDAPFFHMVLDATETLPPAPSPSTWSQKCGPAHVLEVGTIGNNIFNNNQYGQLSYSVFTNSSLRFTNGKDPQQYTAVQQSDINNAATTLINANSPDPQQVLQPQIQSNQRMVSTPQCKPNIVSNHQAGDRASNVTVTVHFTCSGEVYDYTGAIAMAVALLKAQAASKPGPGYALVGTIKTTFINATLSNPGNGTISIQVSAAGLWVYQFNTAQEQQLAQLIEGKSKQVALETLTNKPGIDKVSIQIPGDDTLLLPTRPDQISFVIQSPSGP
ncbi:MAG TPA: serine/threonine-protein kinase [Ktedonobacteraceae bacterium]|nr:serine/threonine-protein kinase [Ktedonobacteraceae bacterium]